MRILITLHRKFYVTHYVSVIYRDLTPRRTGVIPHLSGLTTHLNGNIPQNLCELFESNLGLSHKIFGI